MATLSIEVISKETIKPSSPTPDHLNHYKLSFTDQLSPPVYNPMVLFYAPDHSDIEFNIDDISNRLKSSLSEIWAATTFGDDYIESPQFEAATLIPTKDLSGNVPGFGLENQKQPSSVESLSTIIWTRFVAVTKDESEPEELYTVNLRPRTDPPQPQSSFGNLFSIAITIPILKNGDQGHGYVHPVRKGISKIDKDL
nr:salutaridinol 7-o-acetyltransferase [Quercus suber]